MAKEKSGQTEIKTETIRTKKTERECPRCGHILIINDDEQCHECHNCGYIDCGDE